MSKNQTGADEEKFKPENSSSSSSDSGEVDTYGSNVNQRENIQRQQERTEHVFAIPAPVGPSSLISFGSFSVGQSLPYTTFPSTSLTSTTSSYTNLLVSPYQHHSFPTPSPVVATPSSHIVPTSPGVIVRATQDISRHHQGHGSTVPSQRDEQSQSEQQSHALDLRTSTSHHLHHRISHRALLLTSAPTPDPSVSSPDLESPFQYCLWCKHPIIQNNSNPGFCRDSCFSYYRRQHYKKQQRVYCASCGKKGDWELGGELDCDSSRDSGGDLGGEPNNSLSSTSPALVIERYCDACKTPSSSFPGDNSSATMETFPRASSEHIVPNQAHLPTHQQHQPNSQQQQLSCHLNLSHGEFLAPCPPPPAMSRESTQHSHREIRDMNPLPPTSRPQSSRHRQGGLTCSMASLTRAQYPSASDVPSTLPLTFHQAPSPSSSSILLSYMDNNNQRHYGSPTTTSSSSMQSHTGSSREYVSCPIRTVTESNNNPTTTSSVSTESLFQMSSPPQAANQQSQEPSMENMTMTFKLSPEGSIVNTDGDNNGEPSDPPQADEAVVAAANTLLTMVTTKKEQKRAEIKKRRLGNAGDMMENAELPPTPLYHPIARSTSPVHHPMPPPATTVHHLMPPPATTVHHLMPPPATPIHHPMPSSQSSSSHTRTSAFATVVRNAPSQQVTNRSTGTAMLNSPPVALVPPLGALQCSQTRGTGEEFNQCCPTVAQRDQQQQHRQGGGGGGLGLRDYLCQQNTEMQEPRNILRHQFQSTPCSEQNYMYPQQPQQQQPQQHQSNFNSMYQVPLSIDIPRSSHHGSVPKRARMDCGGGSKEYSREKRKTGPNQGQSSFSAQHLRHHPFHREQYSSSAELQQRRYQQPQHQYPSSFQQQQYPSSFQQQHYQPNLQQRQHSQSLLRISNQQQEQQCPGVNSRYFGVTTGQWPAWTNNPHAVGNIDSTGRGSIPRIRTRDLVHQHGNMMSLVQNDGTFNPNTAREGFLPPSSVASRPHTRSDRDTPRPGYRSTPSVSIIPVPSQPPTPYHHHRIPPSATVTSAQLNRGQGTTDHLPPPRTSTGSFEEPCLSVVTSVIRERENGETRSSTVRTSTTSGGVTTLVTSTAPPPTPSSTASSVQVIRVAGLNEGPGTCRSLTEEQQEVTETKQETAPPSKRGRGGARRSNGRTSKKAGKHEQEGNEHNGKTKEKKCQGPGKNPGKVGRPRGGGGKTRGGAAALEVPNTVTESNRASTSSSSAAYVQSGTTSSSSQQNETAPIGNGGEGGGHSSNTQTGGSGQTTSLSSNPSTTITFSHGGLTNGGNITPRSMPPPPPLYLSPHFRLASGTLSNGYAHPPHNVSPPLYNGLPQLCSPERRRLNTLNMPHLSPSAVPVFLPVPIVVPVAECAYNALVKDAINRDHANPRQPQQGEDNYRDYQTAIDCALRMSLLIAGRKPTTMHGSGSQATGLENLNSSRDLHVAEQPDLKPALTFELAPSPINNPPELPAAVLQPPFILPPPISFPPPAQNISPPHLLAGSNHGIPGPVINRPCFASPGAGVSPVDPPQIRVVCDKVKIESKSPDNQHDSSLPLDVGNEVEIYADQEEEGQENKQNGMVVKLKEEGDSEEDDEGILVIAEDDPMDQEDKDEDAQQISNSKK